MPGPVSAWLERRARRALLPRVRAAFPAEVVEALGERFGAPDYAGEGPLKYFDHESYLALNVERALRLGLHRARPLRVLDLGCGMGYLMYVAERLGHRATGVDFEAGNAPDTEAYAPVLAALGLERRLHRIEAFAPLPDLGGPFDLVTAYQICFALHEEPERWDVPEWRAFLADLSRQLTRDARVVLSFNWSKRHGGWMSDALRAFFEDAGAKVRGEEVALVGLARQERCTLGA